MANLDMGSLAHVVDIKVENIFGMSGLEGGIEVSVRGLRERYGLRIFCRLWVSRNGDAVTHHFLSVEAFLQT